MMTIDVVSQPAAQATEQRSARKRGFTLTEIAIVLGIIGLILGAVWSAASSVYGSANATKFSQQIGQYLAAIRGYCANTTCTTTSIANVGVSPPSLTGASVTPTISATTNDVLVDYTNLPNSASSVSFCNAIYQAVTTIGGSMGPTGAAADTHSETPSCPTQTGAATCAAVSGYTVTSTNGGNCSGGSPPSAMKCTLSIPQSTVCVSGLSTMGFAFTQSY